MLVKYDGHEVLDSAKFMMSTEEALDVADYCRFKPLYLPIEADLERRWVLGGDREKWPEESHALIGAAAGLVAH
jgi:hypothetical protein